MTAADRKPLFWIGSSQKDMQGMPEYVKDVFGSALLDAQYGDTPEPKNVKDRVRARFRAAEEDHQRRFGG